MSKFDFSKLLSRLKSWNLRFDQWGLIVSVCVIAVGFVFTATGTGISKAAAAIEQANHESQKKHFEDSLNAELNGLSGNEFKELVKEIVLTGERGTMGRAGNKYEYYYNLEKNGKTYFVSFYADRNDLPEKANFLCGTSVDYSLFASQSGGISKRVERQAVTLDCPAVQPTTAAGGVDPTSVTDPANYTGIWQVTYNCGDESHVVTATFEERNRSLGNLNGSVAFPEDETITGQKGNRLAVLFIYPNTETPVQISGIGQYSGLQNYSWVTLKGPLPTGGVSALSGNVERNQNECGSWTATKQG